MSNRLNTLHCVSTKAFLTFGGFFLFPGGGDAGYFFWKRISRKKSPTPHITPKIMSSAVTVELRLVQQSLMLLSWREFSIF